MWKKGRYQVRRAAGQFWLMDMEQPAGAYFPPIGMNESGAIIFECYAETQDIRQCARKLQEEFGIDLSEAEADASAFLGQLRSRGVQI